MDVIEQITNWLAESFWQLLAIVIALIVVLGAVFSRCFALVFGSMKGESVNGIRISTTS